MSDETTVRVPLTVEQRAEHADTMAGLLAQIAAIRRQKADADEEFREEIKALDEQLQALGRTLREGAEDRAQLDLTFPQEQAAKALHDVAAAACTCDSPDAPVKSIDCPIHGVKTRGENAAVDDEGPIPVGAEAVAGFVIPEDVAVEMLANDLETAGVVPAGAEVETIAPATPPVVDEFIAAQKSRRRRRAEA